MFSPFPYHAILIIFYFHLMDFNEILKIIDVFVKNQYYIYNYFIFYSILEIINSYLFLYK